MHTYSALHPFSAAKIETIMGLTLLRCFSFILKHEY